MRMKMMRKFRPSRSGWYSFLRNSMAGDCRLGDSKIVHQVDHAV